MALVYVEVDLDDISDDDLIAEVERRSDVLEYFEHSLTPDDSNVVALSEISELVQDLYYKRKKGQDYQQQLEQLIYRLTGRI